MRFSVRSLPHPPALSSSPVPAVSVWAEPCTVLIGECARAAPNSHDRFRDPLSWFVASPRNDAAFEDIREDMSNSYTITYYPQPNPNEGFRSIKVEILSDPGKEYRIHSRPGYRPGRSF